MRRAALLLTCFFAGGFVAAETGPCVYETDFPLADAKLWMKVTSLENFSKGTPLKIDGRWDMSSARFFGDGREWSTAEWYALGKTSCDGIYLREEVTSKGARWEEPGLRTEVRRVKSGYEVTVEATLYNPKGNHDKLVTLSYQLLSKEGRLLASGERIQRAPDNAKSGNNADAIFLLSPDEVQEVARLRLSITTKDY
jgi:hypothetical protein